MNIKIQFTYDKTTPASAGHGDSSEHGFYKGGCEYPIGGCEVDPEDCYALAECPEAEQVTAREAVREIRQTLGAFEVERCGDLLCCYESDGSEDYCTGENTRKCAHVCGNARLLAAMEKELSK